MGTQYTITKSNPDSNNTVRFEISELIQDFINVTYNNDYNSISTKPMTETFDNRSKIDFNDKIAKNIIEMSKRKKMKCIVPCATPFKRVASFIII